ncbi:MAG: YfhO family protein, partial [Actinomycetota bacterium]|nr:YfhO family protein [Actinomycetota bacterium]
DYREISPEQVRIAVRATAPSIVVVRTTFEDGWRATVDGVEESVLPVDGFLQGVAVPAGEHEVRLTYRDPAVSAGVRAGLVAWTTLALAGLAAFGVERRRARLSRPATPDGEAPPR